VLAGRAALRDFAVTDAKGGELLAVPLFEMRIASANLLAGRTNLASVLLQQPQFRVVRDAKGAWNLAALAAESGGETGAEGAKKGPAFRLEIAEFRVMGGNVHVTDGEPNPPLRGKTEFGRVGRARLQPRTGFGRQARSVARQRRG
jgi:hypothetical protein